MQHDQFNFATLLIGASIISIIFVKNIKAPYDSIHDGFWEACYSASTKKITVELKSLNSKNLDLNARMPSAYREKELDLRKIIASSLVRGKVDFGLYVEYTGAETSSVINKEAVRAYMKQLAAIADGDNLRLMEMALRMPDSMKTEREDIDEEEYKAIQAALKEALIEINKFRSEEGSVLEGDFIERIKTLESLLEQVLKMDPDRQTDVRERLEKAVADLNTDVDSNRLSKN